MSFSEMITIEKTMREDLDKLQHRQIKMEREIANLFEMDLIYPFLSPDLIEFAYNIPISDHFVLVNGNKPIRKVILRKLAISLGLSDSISNQQKKALQYGSGTKKLVKQLSKNAGYSQVSNWFESLV
jgi:asparagine synthetase B (glutamine-hydrolysing)